MRALLVLAGAGAALLAQAQPGALGTAPVSPDFGPLGKGPMTPGQSLGFTQQIAVTGRLLLEDRVGLPEPVQVDCLCRGRTMSAVTDEKGRFSIPVGTQQAAKSALGTAVPEVGDCRVVVRVPGFEDLEVKLKHTTRLGDLALGDLTLKALGPESAVIFSAVARKAPGKARSGYIQALTSIGAGKYEEAVASLDKAIRAFPEYSSAFELKGEVLEQMGRREAARECYRQAIAADAGYGKPAVRLAEMAADDNNPEEAAKWAAMANRLAPGAFPKIYLIEGSAYFNLKRAEEAGRAAQAGIDADRKDMVPGLHRLLGEVLYAQKRYSAARGEFDRYLSDAPEAPDSGDVRAKAGTCEKLAKIEGR